MAEKQQALDEFKQFFDEARSRRQRFEPDWQLSIAFLVGDQWAFWNRSRLDRPIPRKGQVLLVDNRIMGIVGSRIARKTKSRPSFVATPASLDEADVKSAQLGEKVLESDWNDLELTHKLMVALSWAELPGAGFWKIYWDRSKGRKDNFIFDAETDEPLMASGRPMRADQLGDQGIPEGYAAKEIADGDVCVDVISPFEFYPDPLATSLDDAEWVIECKVRSTEYVKKAYDVEVEGDSDPPATPADGRLAPLGVGATTFGATEAPRTGKRRGVRVFEFWGRPSSKWPKGIRVVWANDRLLYKEEGPVDPMPYVMFAAQQVPGRFWPVSVTSQLRGPQIELNKVESQIRESAQRLGNPALLWSKMAGKAEYQGLPGEVIRYDDTTPNAKPDYLRPPELPAYVQNEVERIERSFQEISGLHEVSKATVPTGVTAASAINLLQEADDTRLGPEVTLMEESLGKAGTKILKLRALYTPVARLLRIAGEDGDWDIQEFKGEMLSDATNVEVQGGSMMPRSKSAKQAAMIEVFQLAIQYGVPLKPRNIRRFFKDYEVGGIDRLFADLGPDEAQIAWENRQLATGKPLIGNMPPDPRTGQPQSLNTFDDDDLHIEGHEEFQKSGRWRQLPPPIQAAFQAHVDAHRQRRMQALEKEKQAQAQAVQQQLQAQTQADIEKETAAIQAKAAAEMPLEEAKMDHDLLMEEVRSASQNGGQQQASKKGS